MFGKSGSDSEGEYGKRHVYREDMTDQRESSEYGLKRSTRNLPVSNVDEVNKVRMSRFRLDQWVHMPYFSNVVVGSYVRIGIGSNDGRSVYRVAEVMEVVEMTKVYSIIKNPTIKGLRLRHGSQVRMFEILIGFIIVNSASI